MKQIRVAGLVVEAETRHFVLCAAQSNLIPENAAGTLEYLHFRLTDMVARTAFAPPQDQRLYVCFVSERQLGGRNWLLKTSAAASSANALKDKVRYENRSGIARHGGTYSHNIADYALLDTGHGLVDNAAATAPCNAMAPQRARPSRHSHAHQEAVRDGAGGGIPD